VKIPLKSCRFKKRLIFLIFRDSEIAIGAFQPGHTVAEEGDPRGGVHTYRMALWAAHLGGADDAYLNPSSDECMAKVREVTNDFWSLYTADTPEHSDVHMLPYPIQMDEKGDVYPLPEPFDCFPDTSARVLGNKSGYLPVKLTT
jgi:phospholipase D1/2